MYRFFRPEYDYQPTSAQMMAMIISNHHPDLLQEADYTKFSFDGPSCLFKTVQVRKNNSGQNSGHLQVMLGLPSASRSFHATSNGLAEETAYWNESYQFSNNNESRSMCKNLICSAS